MSTQSKLSSGSEERLKNCLQVRLSLTTWKTAEGPGNPSGTLSVSASVGTVRLPTSCPSATLIAHLDVDGKTYSGTWDLPFDERTSNLLRRTVSMITSNLRELVST